LYDLDAAHHYRKLKSGEIARSQLLSDLEALLKLDAGPWTSDSIICYCWCPDRKRHLHENIEACRDHFVMMYYTLYLGSPWPLPLVTKFTNMSIVDRKVQFAYAHRGILRILVEPFEYSSSQAPTLLSMGAGMSDYQVIYRTRKAAVYSWTILDTLTRWTNPILGTLGQVLDALTYGWFCDASGELVSMHDVLRAGGLVGKAMEKFIKQLDAWADHYSKEWLILDSVPGKLRSEAPDAAVRLMRKNLCIYESGAHRRYELQLTAKETPLHKLRCTKCSPLVSDRRAAWVSLEKESSCCRTAFANRLLHRFACPAAQDSQLADLTLSARERLRLHTTKRSEASHAQGQELAGRSRKPLALPGYARKLFLQQVASSHRASGGHPKWHCLSDQILLGLAATGSQSSQAAQETQAAFGDGEQRVNLSDGVGHQPGHLAMENAGGRGPKQGGPSGFLNPVLHACNQRLQAAKILGLTVTEDFKAKTLAEFKALQKTEEGKKQLRAEYDEYLRDHKFKAGPSHTDDPALDATWWGWGTKHLPVPLGAIQKHVGERGLAPNRLVKSSEICAEYRVDPQKVLDYTLRTVTVPAMPCMASWLNECRQAYLVALRSQNLILKPACLRNLSSIQLLVLMVLVTLLIVVTHNCICMRARTAPSGLVLPQCSPGSI